MKEETIAVFKMDKHKYNLLKTTIPFMTAGVLTEKTEYMIIKDRKRIKSGIIWEQEAKKQFASTIAGELLIQKISF